MISPPASLALTLLLGLLIALTPLGTDSWQPILPAMAAELDAPVGAAQLTVTTFFLGLAIGQLAWGPLSDRFGRRSILATGLGLACAAGAASVLARTAAELALGRFVLGVGMSSGPVVGRAVIRDLYSHEQAAGLLARMTIVFSLVPIAAPLAGGAMLLLGGWQAVLCLYVAVCAMLLAVCATRLRETAPPERASIHPLRIAAAFGAIAGERRFVVPYAALLCAQIGIFAFVSSSAFTLVEGLGVPAGHYSFMFAAVMLGQIAGSWASSRLVGRLGTHRLIGAGASIVACSGLAMAGLAWSGVAHWLAVIGPFMLYMLGTALIQSNATAMALSPFPRAAGAASSLMGATQFAVGAAVSTALGLAFEASARPLSTAVALAGAGSFLVEKLFLHGKR